MQIETLASGVELVIPCALGGCRWRVQLPAETPRPMQRRALARLGWRPDPDERGRWICGAHELAPLDA